MTRLLFPVLPFWPFRVLNEIDLKSREYEHTLEVIVLKLSMWTLTEKYSNYSAFRVHMVMESNQEP